MRARVLFFGMLKEVVGRSAEDAEFAEGADLHSVFETYAARYPRLREIARSIVVARNQEFAELSTKIEEGDEIAFLPPVSGGAAPEPPEISVAGNYYALTRQAIDIRAISASLLSGAEGAVITFEGTVRNNTKGRPTLYLDYECYESMALKTMAKIGEEIAAGHQIARVAMVHRLGRMLVGETSVVVIVTAPHRRAAFEAALEGINRLKKLVPIWKKEHFVDGEVWVEGEWDEHVSVAE
ncbi:Molybdopterin synthase subunit MoaD / molybdopterin synthase subunit MoaE [Candidatus Sulfopaludibacter sp. SbA3]|nr:Molybdopterin synthase subunit MoaD / molybdopterin synthase subunit MoaE [Candidatus Sulfopaludibacter sp. SbA3]